VDLTSYLANELRGRSEKDLFETRRETDLSMTGRRTAFSEDYSRLVVLVRDGIVMDLSFEALQRGHEVLMETLGFAGYWRSLRRRGIEGLVRNRALSEMKSGTRKLSEPQS